MSGDVAPGPAKGSGDRGSGTVLVLGLVAVVIALIAALAAMGEAVVARHRAASAADLVALAAASGPDAPDCERAGVVARASAVQLVSCRVFADRTVVVEVVIPVLTQLSDRAPGDAGPPLRARARARAGRPPDLGATSPCPGCPSGHVVIGDMRAGHSGSSMSTVYGPG